MTTSTNHGVSPNPGGPGRTQLRGPGIAAWAALLLLGVSAAAPARAFEIDRGGRSYFNLIKPWITANPIEVVLWVRDTVSAEDEAWIVPDIQAGLDLWE